MKKGVLLLVAALVLGWMAPAEEVSAAQRPAKRSVAAKKSTAKHRAPARKKAVGNTARKKQAKKSKRAGATRSVAHRSATAM